MPKLKPGTIIPTDEEDIIINAGIISDPDTYELSSAEFELLKPDNNPLLKIEKQSININLSPEVITAFRAMDIDWQSRIDKILKNWLAEHHNTPLG